MENLVRFETSFGPTNCDRNVVEFLELRVGRTRRKLGAWKQYSLNKPVHECCPQGRELRSIRDLTRVTRVTVIGRSCGTRESSGGRKRKTELFEWIAGNGPWKGVSKRIKRRSWKSVMFERRYIASMEEKLINGTMRREEMEQRWGMILRLKIIIVFNEMC